MPRITADDTGNSAIPARPGRKQLIVQADVDLRYGWHKPIAFSGANAGVLLKAGDTLTFAGRDLDLQSELYLVTNTGVTANVDYTQKA